MNSAHNIEEGTKVRYQSGKRSYWAHVLFLYPEENCVKVIRRGCWGSIVSQKITIGEIIEVD